MVYLVIEKDYYYEGDMTYIEVAPSCIEVFGKLEDANEEVLKRAHTQELANKDWVREDHVSNMGRKRVVFNNREGLREYAVTIIARKVL